MDSQNIYSFGYSRNAARPNAGGSQHNATVRDIANQPRTAGRNTANMQNDTTQHTTFRQRSGGYNTYALNMGLSTPSFQTSNSIKKQPHNSVCYSYFQDTVSKKPPPSRPKSGTPARPLPQPAPLVQPTRNNHQYPRKGNFYPQRSTRGLTQQRPQRAVSEASAYAPAAQAVRTALPDQNAVPVEILDAVQLVLPPQPVQPTHFAQPAQTVPTAQVVQPIQNVQPVQPTPLIQSTQLAQPPQPAQPTEPAQPVQPTPYVHPDQLILATQPEDVDPAAQQPPPPPPPPLPPGPPGSLQPPKTPQEAVRMKAKHVLEQNLKRFGCKEMVERGLIFKESAVVSGMGRQVLFFERFGELEWEALI